MKVVVVANGEWNSEWGKTELSGFIDILICADGGVNLVISSGRIPDVLIGDLDSVTEENIQKCKVSNTIIKKYPREKDQTDLEIALEYAEMYLSLHGSREDEILLYGAGGGRVDHMLGNISLMLGYAEKGRRVRMKDFRHDLWIVLPGIEIIKGKKGQEISLVTLSEKANIVSKGLYYPLKGRTLYQNGFQGISNVFIKDEAEIEIINGKVLLAVLTGKE